MRSRFLAGFVAAAVGGLILIGAAPIANAQPLSDEVQYHRITFPVQGPVRYSNDWGNARTGHVHQGNDLLGSKLQIEVAAEDGVIGWTRTDGSNMVSLRGDSGWEYWYIHVNNDTPGTDDGLNPPEFIMTPGIQEGSRVTAGQPIAYMGDSGNAEGTSPHLHFEMHEPDGTPVDPYWSLMLAQGKRVNDRCAFDDNPTVAKSESAAPGYWTTTADGTVYQFGGAPNFGSMGATKLSAPMIGLTATADRKGYWELASDGGIFTFGTAKFFGSTGAMHLNKPVVGMAATPTGRGYWLVASDGGIFTFGDAKFFGSTGAMHLNKPVVGMAPTKSGRGYLLVASDGGVFNFGDAKFLGSTAGGTMFPIVDIAPTPSGLGYWMTTNVGTVLPFGDAKWLGSVDHVGYCNMVDVVGMSPTRSGNGYWIQARNGTVYAFGDAIDRGSPANPRAVAVVGY
jgi:hypothetical protein